MVWKSDRPRVLVISFDVFTKSTRARKSARTYAENDARVTYIGMSRPGRSGRWGEPGTSDVDGITVTQVKMRAPSGGTSPRTQAANLLTSYLPAIARMAVAAARTPADVVHVVAAPLAPLGILHRAVHRSRMVLDVTERPGAVANEGSLSAVFARVEHAVLTWVAPRTALALAVVPPDVATLEGYGFERVRLVRNVPLNSWRAPYRDPAPGPATVFASIGTIFEGRAFEALIDAVALAGPRTNLRVDISGTASDEYLAALQARAERCGASSYIRWRGWVSSDEVCDRYLDAHVGLVLYDTSVGGNDGLSNKLMECVSAGRPVLATNAPLNHQFVTDHSVGWTAPSDADGLARAMVEVASTRKLEIQDLARHCRDLSEAELTWEREFLPLLRLLTSSDEPGDPTPAEKKA